MAPSQRMGGRRATCLPLLAALGNKMLSVMGSRMASGVYSASTALGSPFFTVSAQLVKASRICRSQHAA